MGFFKYVAKIPMKHPFAFGTILTGAKTAGLDAMMQKMVEKREELDIRRTLTFGIFGLSFNGAWQYLLFVKVMPRFVPGAFTFAAKPIREKLKDKVGIRGVLLQCFVENGINNPFLYFPLFYMTQEWIAGGRPLDGVDRYKQNWKNDLMAIWSLWGPAQFINFAFSAPWFRIPFVALTSCIWTCYVSLTRGDLAGSKEKEKGKERGHLKEG